MIAPLLNLGKRRSSSGSPEKINILFDNIQGLQFVHLQRRCNKRTTVERTVTLSLNFSTNSDYLFDICKLQLQTINVKINAE